MRVSLVLLVFICFISFSAHAYYGSKANYKWWKNPNIASEMGLTKQQADLIERIFHSNKNKIIRYQKELRQKEIQLRRKLNNSDPNNEEVLKLIDDIEHIKANLTKIKVRMFLKVKGVLTPEQIQILHSIRSRYQGTHH